MNEWQLPMYCGLTALIEEIEDAEHLKAAKKKALDAVETLTGDSQNKYRSGIRVAGQMLRRAFDGRDYPTLRPPLPPENTPAFGEGVERGICFGSRALVEAIPDAGRKAAKERVLDAIEKYAREAGDAQEVFRNAFADLVNVR